MSYSLLTAAHIIPFAFWSAPPQVSKTEVHAGSGQETCLVTLDGRIKCWGSGAYGLLGSGSITNIGTTSGQMGGSLPYLSMGSGKRVSKVATGLYHACAIMTDGSLKCWGGNGAGQLGIGNSNTYGDDANEMGDNLPTVNLGTGRTAVSVVAGDATTCAILDNNDLKCWGYGVMGSLGYENGNNIGANGADMGDNLPAVNLGTGRHATSLTMSQTNNACALLDNGDVKCWGINSSGALGLGDTINRGNLAGQMGDNLPAVSLGTGRTALAVSAGYGYACALLDNQSVKCWGAGGWGVLGQGSPADIGTAPNQMGDHLPAIDLGTGRTAKAISAGADHVCAILDNDSIKCWGRNDFGQLGLGDTFHRGTSAGQMGDSLPTVNVGTGVTPIAISAGFQYTCVILNIGRVKCWGYNASGQLGLEDTTSRGTSGAQMGDSLPFVSWY